MANTRNDWQQRADQLSIEGRAFVGGDYQQALSGETFDCVSPIDEKVLAPIAACDKADADKAVELARSSFESGVWRDRAPKERKAVLLKLADLIESELETFALLETLDMGKPIGDSLAVDIPATLRAIRWTAEAIDKRFDEVAPTGVDELGLVTHEPVGVVAAIVPWNFPMIMASWKYAPALAMGNSVILKPSEKSPLTAIKLAALAKKAGIPDGVFQVLPGFGHTVGKALAEHQDVDVLAFTGSTQTAKALFVAAGQSNMKRVYAEAGGKSPNIIFADAPDLDEAAEAAASAICYNQGEVCTAGSRLLVEDSIADSFIEKVKAAFAKWQPGHPLDPNTTVGAIVDKGQLDRVMHYIRLAKEEGATLEVGGEEKTVERKGFYVEPALFADVKDNDSIAQEEVFGPVVSVIRFTSEEEALAIANNSIYGLAAGVWTANLSLAHRMAKRLNAGSVWVNQYDGGDMTAPFGGFKQSGNGRDKSMHAFDKYSELKATWIKI